ncbi:MarR family winged helix-turn-helix transcriptional regulator [Indioceanicola profundi]|uniref:MarR family winged helix-turn-helix transcriptional regulator n=1 Tax=Indioceanicola profundi TaxID=2220096 RepID=UPI000E6AB938|nr:winged helix DNA-binding protein [Indioceanicola profundi]
MDKTRAAASLRPEQLDPLVRVLEAFRLLDPDLPIQYALSFLTIAQNEGMSIRDLSERLGIAQSSASRNVAALSKWHSFGKEGHDLVQAEEDPRERRRKIVTLTPKGRTLARHLAELIGGDGSQGGGRGGDADEAPLRRARAG